MIFDAIVLLIVLIALGQVVTVAVALVAELIDARGPHGLSLRFIWARVLDERDEREGRVE